MEFYKLCQIAGQYQLEEEKGQEGSRLSNRQLSFLAACLANFYIRQNKETLPLIFRKYLTAYYADGEMEYISLLDAKRLVHAKALDGFATTWLNGEEENRVWIGTDGIIENRGPNGKEVYEVLQQMVVKLNEESDKNKCSPYSGSDGDCI